jgi:hypothetical protein
VYVCQGLRHFSGVAGFLRAVQCGLRSASRRLDGVDTQPCRPEGRLRSDSEQRALAGATVFISSEQRALAGATVFISFLHLLLYLVNLVRRTQQGTAELRQV